jgi:hypothetical protein
VELMVISQMEQAKSKSNQTALLSATADAVTLALMESIFVLEQQTPQLQMCLLDQTGMMRLPPVFSRFFIFIFILFYETFQGVKLIHG